MKAFLLNAFLALTWAALTGEVSQQSLAVGFVIGYVILWFARRSVERSHYFKKVRQLAGFLAFYLWDLTRSSLRIAYDVVTPRHRMRPAILAIPLDAETDIEITVFANLLSLTPGSLSLDVSPDRRFLYVHAMYVDDPDGFRREVKDGLERRVLELLR